MGGTEAALSEGQTGRVREQRRGLGGARGGPMAAQRRPEGGERIEPTVLARILPSKTTFPVLLISAALVLAASSASASCSSTGTRVLPKDVPSAPCAGHVKRATGCGGGGRSSVLLVDGLSRGSRIQAAAMQGMFRLRGGGSSIEGMDNEDVEARVEREKKESKKRRMEKKKWKQLDEAKAAEAAIKEGEPKIVRGADGVIYALDPDFPEEVNYVPKQMKELSDESNVLDLRIMNATEKANWEDDTINHEANQFDYMCRKPLATTEQEKEVLDLLTDCEKVKQAKRGSNEVTKMINRNMAEFVLLAADTIPIEIIMHLPLLCEDKGVPYLWVSSRDMIGKACGLPRPVTAAAILSNEQSHLIGRIRKARIMIDNLRGSITDLEQTQQLLRDDDDDADDAD
jgi:U4/U6 small nuclear ribonucleoprotein SNU13